MELAVIGDQRRMLEVFRDGLLKKLSLGEKGRDEVLRILQSKLHEIVAEHGDKLMIALIGGQIAVSVHTALMDGETAKSGNLEREINDLVGNIMPLLSEDLSYVLKKNLHNFPDNLTADWRADFGQLIGLIYLTVLLLALIGTPLTCLAKSLPADTVVAATFSVMIMGALTTPPVVLLSQAISGDMEGTYPRPYHHFLKQVAQNIKAESIELLSGLKKIAKLLDGPGRQTAAMDQGDFESAVKEAVDVLILLDDMLNDRPAKPKLAFDSPYRGNSIQELTANEEAMREYVSNGIAELTKGIKDGKKRRKLGRTRAIKSSSSGLPEDSSSFISVTPLEPETARKFRVGNRAEAPLPIGAQTENDLPEELEVDNIRATQVGRNN